MTYLSLILNVLKLLNWLVGWLERQKAKQEGREEVYNELKKNDQEITEEIKKLRDTSPSFDAAIDGLSKLSDRRRNKVLNDK